METKRKWLRIEPSDLALEIISTVIAILLALAANHWLESHTRERALRESLASIRQELTENRAHLVSKMGLHRRIQIAMSGFADAHIRDGDATFEQVFGVFQRSAPQGFQSVKGHQIAWQIAQNSQTITDMPYRIRAVLTEAYDEQNTLRQAEQRFFDTAFSTGAPSRDYFAQAYGASVWLSDIVYDERLLLRAYDDALNVLPRA